MRQLQDGELVGLHIGKTLLAIKCRMLKVVVPLLSIHFLVGCLRVPRLLIVEVDISDRTHMVHPRPVMNTYVRESHNPEKPEVPDIAASVFRSTLIRILHTNGRT
jgi:hypothetical protein